MYAKLSTPNVNATQQMTSRFGLNGFIEERRYNSLYLYTVLLTAHKMSFIKTNGINFYILTLKFILKSGKNFYSMNHVILI